MTKHILLIQLLVFFSMGCGEASLPPAVAPEIEEAPPPDSDGQDASPYSDEDEDEEPVICEDTPVPVSMIRDNVEATDLSAVVRIDKVEITGEKGGPPKTSGYVNHMYTVTVLEMYSGPEVKTFTYGVMAEAGISPRKVGTVLFVSLCGEPGESYYSPDNGYVFKASQAFIDGLKREEIGKDTKKTSAACQSH